MSHASATNSGTVQASAGARRRIVVAGCGGAGCNVIGSHALEPPILTMALNSDAAHLGRMRADVKVHISAEDAMKVVTTDPRIDISSEVRHAERIASAVEGASLVNAISGLGGRTGWRLASAVGKLTRRKRVPVLCTAILPFGGEGGSRRAEAAAQAKALRGECDGLLVVRNDRLSAVAPQMTFVQAIDVAARLATLVPREFAENVPEDFFPRVAQVMSDSSYMQLEALDGPPHSTPADLVALLRKSKWLSMTEESVVGACVIMRAHRPDARIETEVEIALRESFPRISSIHATASPSRINGTGLIALLGFDDEPL